jgi:hypothetical protein
MPEPENADAAIKNAAKQPKKKRKASRKKRSGTSPKTQTLAFPKHSILKCLRIPQAILEQNAGNECTDKEAAKFAGIGYSGLIGVEISSAIKYGLLDRPGHGRVKPTDLLRRI